MKTIPLMSAAVFGLLSLSAVAQDAVKPGPQQEQLKVMAGVWDGKGECFMVPGKPVESRGVFTAKMDLGGLFLATHFKGDMAGVTFEGRGYTTYDPFKKQYVGVWVDSMVPTIFTSKGEFDTSGKVFTETMEGVDPKGKAVKMRAVTTMKGDDRMTFQMFDGDKTGKDGLTMEIAYTRQK
jgi:hypothetical protein